MDTTELGSPMAQSVAYPPGHVRCPECHGARAVTPPGIGASFPLPCPRCAGKGYIALSILAAGYRMVRSPDREGMEEITLGLILTHLVLLLGRLAPQLAHVRPDYPAISSWTGPSS